jgi:endoglucanase Acf2
MKKLFISKKNIAVLAVILLIGCSIFLINKNRVSNSLASNNDTTKKIQKKQFNKKHIYKGEYFLTQKNKNNLKTLPIPMLKTDSKFDNIFTLDKKKAIKTNQWFSSIYFMPGSEPIFSFPLAIKFNDRGFDFSAPLVGGNDDLITGAFQSDIKVVFPSEVKAYVLETGDFSVKVALLDGGKNTIATVTLTHGSPYLFLTMKNNQVIKVYTNNNQKFISKDGAYTLSKPESELEYGFFKSMGVRAAKKIDNEDKEYIEYNIYNNKVLKEKPFVSFGVFLQKNNWEMFKSAGLNPIESTEFKFLKTEKGEYFNIFNIKTRKEEGTLFGLLPHQINNLVDNGESNTRCLRDKYFKTIRGNQVLCYGNSFYIKNDTFLVPKSFLNIQNLPEEYKVKMVSLLKEDISKINNFQSTDTYFLGKELLRAAQLYDFAKQLNLEAESLKLQNILEQEFSSWLTNTKSGNQPDYGKYLTYDDTIKGIVGHKTSFGSEKFNDHHFHYGYFIHVAAILGKYDKNFLETYSELINLLVKDYLNVNRSDMRFAFIRNFDIYEGHSWASGSGIFGDGNNQESSSEAIHAYYAGYLWGEVVNDENLKEVSKWLYNQEFNSALTYWLLAKKNSPNYEKYKHNLISLIWGGKAEYGTWFSGEPEAKLGIQLIPFTPGSEYLKYVPKDIVRAQLAETSFPQKRKLFFDQLLMYKAMENPREALKLFANIQDADIDGGNSRSFLYAWIVTRIK